VIDALSRVRDRAALLCPEQPRQLLQPFDQARDARRRGPGNVDAWREVAGACNLAEAPVGPRELYASQLGLCSACEPIRAVEFAHRRVSGALAGNAGSHGTVREAPLTTSA
jgi:hypothetical protein